MKLSILSLLVLLSFNIFSQKQIDFNKCTDSFEPAVCTSKLLAYKIEELKGYMAVPQVLSGIYTYEKGFNKEKIGNRKIVVEDKGTTIKYYGSDKELYTTFKCLPNEQVCGSNERHMLIKMGRNELFIDWNDDSNGHYRWIAHKRKRPNH